MGGGAQGGPSSWSSATFVVHPETSQHQTLVPTSGLHLSRSESSCPPCLHCATLLGTTKAHCHVHPIPGCGKPLRHTGASCCSWELWEALSGPCARMCPMNNVYFCSRTCHNTRRSGSSHLLGYTRAQRLPIRRSLGLSGQSISPLTSPVSLLPPQLINLYLVWEPYRE